MVEVAKPDYLSLVNQGGSGFNISELVTSIVAAEIEPKKALNESKKNDADNAISGIGFLNSQSSVTKTAFDTRMTDKFFNVSSSNSAVVEFSSTDEMKLQPSQTEISNVSLAKKMVFELPGFTDLSSTINQAISINESFVPRINSLFCKLVLISSKAAFILISEDFAAELRMPFS